MSFINLTVSGIDAALADGDARIERASDLMPVIDEIRAGFMVTLTQRFDQEGPGWAPLAESTVLDKKRKGLREEILQATGAMRESFISDGAPGNIYDVALTGDGGRVEMGSDYKSPNQRGRWAGTALAAFHQFGTTRMPARPILADVKAQALEWADLLGQWLRSGI